MPSLYLLLVLQVFSWQLILTPGEAVVYYVTPTEPPNTACPQDQPCQTLDHYFSRKEEYFNSSKVNNTTMLLLGGEHVLSGNNAEFVNVSWPIDLSGHTEIELCYGHAIKDLETFEMIGLKTAEDVVVQLFIDIILMNITQPHFANLTFSSANHNCCSIYLVGPDDLSTANTSQSAEKTGPVDNITFVTVVNGTIFNGVSVSHHTLNTLQFSTIVANSRFHDQSKFEGISGVDFIQKNYIRELIITNCTSILELVYGSTNIKVSNSTVTLISEGMLFLLSNVEINGTVQFSQDYDDDSFPDFLFWSSNLKITGNVTFSQASISADSSIITLSGNISFLNNIGDYGGAMSLYSSTLNIAPNTSVYFYNNKATETGGAIYVGNYANVNNPLRSYLPCFYQFLDYDPSSSNRYNISFYNNSAARGGNHVYGAFIHSGVCYATLVHPVLSCCVQNFFHYDTKSLSPVSSDPLRACLCKHGSQQCNESHLHIEIYPGETFTLPVLIVGADFGATVGSVHAVFENPVTTVQLKPSSQYMQGIRKIDDGVCSELNYTVFSHNKHEKLVLLTKEGSWTAYQWLYGNVSDNNFINEVECKHCDPADYISTELLFRQQLHLSITLLPCPPGFQLKGDHDPPGCECHPILAKNNVKCQFISHMGYHIWSSPLWLGTDNNSNLYLAQYCPFDYCINGDKRINLSNSSGQCAFNRNGTLCGGCQKGYSLAIGSSHCIHCPNNNNLAILIFFVAAGILLVAIIGIFNLTVTQGMINGLIFYANIVWTYQRILFPQQVESNPALAFLRTLIAWLNLDFGIHTCFVQGLDALHKTWPQYFFIFYIWGIAIVIIFTASHSTKLTDLLGERPVPILVTLFLLSYTKLFQIITASVGFTKIDVFGTNSLESKNYTLRVWSLDGNHVYCSYPHALLFTVALLVFLTVWLPYTVVLFSVQWLRKISHLKLLQWVPKFTPIYDVHLAPLKDKYLYWFGVLLIVRGILLVILTLTYTAYPEINYIVLLLTASLLLVYSNYYRVYKRKIVQLNENFFLILLIFVGASGVLEEQRRRIVIYTSVGVGFLVFCGMIVGLKLHQICCKKGKVERDFVPNEPRRKQRQEIPDDAQFRDSIFDETEPLIHDTETVQY